MTAMREKVSTTATQALAGIKLIGDPVDLLTYERDAGLDAGRPDAVALPRTTAEVVRLVRWAGANAVPITARGAGTGLSGGAVAEHGGLILHCSQFDQLLEFDTAGRFAIVQPGITNLALDTLVRTAGLCFPPDPSSGRAATIGGNIAENSGGPHCFKYGVTTNYVTGLELVLANGEALRTGGRALDYPEYDLTGLITGSEGTLAIVTEATLRLLRAAPAVKTLMVAFESVEDAGVAVSAIIAGGLVPATLEMMDQKMMRIIEDFAHAGLPLEAGAALIVEADGYPESVTAQIEEMAAILHAHDGYNLRIAQSAQERDAIWYGRKSAVGAMSRLAPSYYLVDVTVPRSRLAAMLAGVNRICEGLDLQVGYVFHAGDGNLHPLILIERPGDRELMARVFQAGRAIVELCLSFDGSITGEHGVGIEKRAFMPLMFTPDELAVMREVKAAFDPQGLLNPGKIFPEDGVSDNLPTVHRPPSTVHRPPSTVHRPLSTVHHPPSTIHHPSSASEAAALLQACIGAGQSVRIAGGGSKSANLPPADGTLTTAGLRGISHYARDDLYVSVGAGTPLGELQAVLAGDRMWVPLVSPWPEATVGGIVATACNAPLRMRYGGVRDLILSATVAMADGRLIRTGRPVVKNVAGYDMTRLFTGAHGTLGLLTEVTLKIVPQPRARVSLLLPTQSCAQGLELGALLLPLCLNASALLFGPAAALGNVDGAPYTLIYTVEGPVEDVAAELAEARAILPAGTAIHEVAELAGSERWATWLGAPASGPLGPLRVGVAPCDLATLVVRLDTAQLAGAGWVADLASSLLYLREVTESAAVRELAERAGGYAVALRGGVLTPRPLPAPLKTLRERWGAGGLLNPGCLG